MEKESSLRRWYSICPTLAKSDNFPIFFKEVHTDLVPTVLYLGSHVAA